MWIKQHVSGVNRLVPTPRLAPVVEQAGRNWNSEVTNPCPPLVFGLLRQSFTALDQVGYDGCITMESLEPDVQSAAKLCCMWRRLADSAGRLATEGPTFPRDVYQKLQLGREQGA